MDEELRRHLEPRERRAAPDFDSTFAAAERRFAAERGRIGRIGAGVAAAAAVIAVAVLLRAPEPDPVADTFRINEAILGGTYWRAPSDALLPRREFDIYQDIPELPGSTQTEQGTFL